MNLNFKTKNSLSRKNYPDKNPFKSEIQPNSVSLLITHCCVTEHSPIKEYDYWNFPKGPMVKNLPVNAGDIFNSRSKRIPPATERPSPRITTTEPTI